MPFQEREAVRLGRSAIDDHGRAVPAGAVGVIVRRIPGPDPACLVEVAGRRVTLSDSDLRCPTDPLPAPPEFDGLAERMEKLRRDRIAFLGTGIDDFMANFIVAELRRLQERARGRAIRLYVNSPGGYVSAGFVILDALGGLKVPIETTCIGQASGMAALLVAAGTKGRRFARSSSRFLLTPIQGREKTPEEIGRFEAWTAERLAAAVGRPPESVRRDMQAETRLDARAALEYGLIDHVIDGL